MASAIEKKSKKRKAEEVTVVEDAQTSERVKESKEEKKKRKEEKKLRKQLESDLKIEADQPVSKKRKRDVDIDAAVDEPAKQDKKDKKDKKAKKSKDKNDKKEKKEKKPKQNKTGESEPVADTEMSGSEEQPTALVKSVIIDPYQVGPINPYKQDNIIIEKKDPKPTKSKKNKKTVEEQSIPTESGQEQEQSTERTPLPDAREAYEDYQNNKKNRFIVFVGNLPFTATKPDVEKHFKKIQPSSVRLMTHKDTGKPKGFGFLEFDRYDHMKSCLQLYHHSEFNDGKSPPRKINIELTVGGGGGGANRKQKIEDKNEKLRGERKRRITKENEEKKQRQGQGQQATAEPENPSTEQNGIHPSRLARMQR